MKITTKQNNIDTKVAVTFKFMIATKQTTKTYIHIYEKRKLLIQRRARVSFWDRTECRKEKVHSMCVTTSYWPSPPIQKGRRGSSVPG